jgi:hypothetical protein
MTHATDGKKEPVNDKKQALESTCNYVPDFGKSEPEKHKGWLNQAIAAGNGDLTSHYRVLESAGDCPNAWGSYLAYAFQRNWDPKQYFQKK